MALADAVQGALRPTQLVTWAGDDGAVNLAGATLSGVIVDAAGTSRAIAGTLTVTDADAGEFEWGYAAGDVAEAGVFYVQFAASFGSGATPQRSLMSWWRVLRWAG